MSESAKPTESIPPCVSFDFPFVPFALLIRPKIRLWRSSSSFWSRHSVFQIRNKIDFFISRRHFRANLLMFFLRTGAGGGTFCE